MKATRILFLLPLLLLTACPEKGGSGSSAATPSLKVAVCQPDEPEAIPPLISSLTPMLKEQVWTRQRGLELQVVLTDGTTQSVPAPTEKSWMEKLFGPNTPAVREEKLTAHLAALEATLKSGCNNQPMSLTTLKAVPETLYAGETFVAWAANGGGKNPWTQEKQKPTAFVADSPSLNTALNDQQTQNLLVLTSSVPMPVVKAKLVKQPTPKVMQKAKKNPAQVAATSKDAPSATPPVVPPQRSTLVFNLADKQRDTNATPPASSQPIGVPEGSEYFYQHSA